MRVHAVRAIEEGEEITSAYTDVIKSSIFRQADLEPYDMVCTCAACSKGNESDIARVMIQFYDLARDLNPENKSLEVALRELELLEMEGLECIKMYRDVLEVVTDLYIEEEHKENAVYYGKKLYKAQCAIGQGDRYSKYRDLDGVL